MDAHGFWEIYAGGLTPAEFMRLFGCSEPQACAAAYVDERPHVYGIVRRGTWQDTFAPEMQHSRHEVRMGLATYLEETRGEWEAELAANPPAPRQSPSPTLDTPLEELAAESGVAEDAEGDETGQQSEGGAAEAGDSPDQTQDDTGPETSASAAGETEPGEPA